MGIDKAFVKYGENCLYEYSLSLLKKNSNDILISSGNPRFSQLNLTCVPDEIKGAGPIGGIYSCLKKIKNKSAIVLPCDLPLLNDRIITALAKNSDDYDISIIVNYHDLPEPLIGIYAVSLIPVMKEMIDSNQYKLQNIFKKVKTNFVRIPWASAEVFKNVNNPAELNSLPPPSKV